MDNGVLSSPEYVGAMVDGKLHMTGCISAILLVFPFEPRGLMDKIRPARWSAKWNRGRRPVDCLSS